MVRATYSVGIDWSGNNVFTDTGETIALSRVRRIVIDRGRDRASQTAGFSIAGRCSIVLDNRSGDYSSFNASSPLTGLILPGRKVRVQAGSGSFPYTFPIVFNDNALWAGFLENIIPVPSVSGDVVANLEAVGPLSILAARDIDVAMQTAYRSDLAIGKVLDAAGWAAADRSLDTGLTTFNRWWVGRQNALQAAREIEKSELGFLYETADGKIGFKNRQARLSGTALTSQVTFSDAVGATNPYSGITQDDPLPTIFNIAETDVQLFTVGALAVLWTHPETGASSPTITRNGGTRTFTARYPVKDSLTQDVGVDAWTTPVVTTDFLVNSASDGSGTNISASIAVAVVKTGNSMEITLTNNHATLDGFITFAQARGTPVSQTDPVTVLYSDATSKTAFGDRMFPERPPWIPTSQEADDWARFIVSVGKDPQPMLRMRFSANRNQTMFHAALIRDVGDRITVTANNDTKLGLSRDFFIEHIRHTITPDGGAEHWTEWDLSDAEQFSDFFVLGTSRLGETTRLAY